MQQHHGFTLLEILLVIIMIGVLSSVAYPTLKHHLVKVRRLHAIQLLLATAAQLEEYALLNSSYVGAKVPQDKYYRLTLHAEPNGYVLKALPQQTDTICQTFSLDHLGNKAITGTGTLTECWP